MTKRDDLIRTQLLQLLNGGESHINVYSVVKAVPEELWNLPIVGLPNTLVGILEHIRLAQADILDYLTNENYTEKSFPDDYWPSDQTKCNWKTSFKHYQKDLKILKAMIKTNDLFAQIPHGEKGHTLFREILILSDHTAYHLGQMVVILRLKGAWEA
ncbi:MAG: DinB family protein [Chlamydiales bacterium]